MARDERYLRLHGRQWHVVVAIPRQLHAVLGRTQFKQSLHTDSLSKAQRLRWSVVARMQQEIERVLQEVATKGKLRADDPVLAEALELRGVTAADAYWRRKGEDDTLSEVNRRLIETDAKVIEAKHGVLKARAFRGIALGVATPLMLHRDQWLAEMKVIPRTRQERETSLRMLETWAKAEGYSTTEDITRRVSGEFLAKQLIGAGLAAKTIEKRLSDLSVFWSWMAERGHLGEEPPANPWRGHASVSSGAMRPEEPRPFTDDEVARLMHEGRPDATLLDYMRIAALSGMRIAEIAALKVGDCADGIFTLRDTKDKNKGSGSKRKRLVPIHSALHKRVERLCKGRAASEFLLVDKTDADQPRASAKRGATWDRSMPISKRFGHFRKSVGVHEQPEGQRRSTVDFHSFRRWFVTKTEHAGIPESTAASVVGHGREGMTHGVYSGGPSIEQMRACVEAVKLPPRKRARLVP